MGHIYNACYLCSDTCPGRLKTHRVALKRINRVTANTGIVRDFVVTRTPGRYGRCHGEGQNILYAGDHVEFNTEEYYMNGEDDPNYGWEHRQRWPYD